MYEIRKHKIDIRKHHLARRAAIPSDVRAARDAKICQNLLSAATYASARLGWIDILCYEGKEPLSQEEITAKIFEEVTKVLDIK